MTELSDDVQTFLRLHIPSVMQLEVLLHLRAAAGRPCAPIQISRQVGGSVDAAIGCLTALERAGLVERVDDEHDLCYRYAPTPELRPQVDAVAGAYARRKVAVISYVFSQPDDALRSFSDAFRIRRPPR